MDRSWQENSELDFRVTLEGDIRAGNTETTVIVDLDIGRGTKPYKPAARFVVSIPTFESQEQAEAWLERAKDLFERDLKPAIRDAVQMMFYDSCGLALIEQGIALYDRKGLVAGHLNMAEYLLRERLKIEPGRPPKWTAIELAQAIVEAMAALPIAQRTYNGVTAAIQKRYPDRAPKSGESLRKTVDLLGIDWKRIKRSASKRS